MDFVIIALTFLLASTLLHIIISSLAKRGGSKRPLPPGPIRLPLIGNLHLLGNKPHESLAKLAKKHGPIMSLKLGQATTIVVSSPEMAKEVLKNQDLAFSSRSLPNALHDTNYQYSVIFLPVDSRWRSLRKILNINIFSVKRLDGNEHIRCKKVEELITYCRQYSETGKAVDIGRAAFRTILNLLSQTFFSKDLEDPDSAKEFECRELIQNILAEAGKPNMVDFYPVLAKIDPQGIRRRVNINYGKLLHLFGGLIDERLKSGAVGDVLDLLLTAGKETPELMDRKQIEQSITDLFVAGIDTTSSTIVWAMTEILNNPDKMKKIQDELAQVVGKGNVIKDADVARLPYLRCVVKETLRVHPPVPFLVPRQVEQDVDVCGYNIPRGSGVMVNVWAIGKDETIWKDALTFQPERFLESEVDIHGQDFELTPFGAGRRICPGLPLASRMMLVMLGSLLNSFDWKPEGENALDMEEKFGFTLQKASPLLVIPVPL